VSVGADAQTGWLVSEFQTIVTLGAWLVLTLFYGLYRSVRHPEPDPIRPSGPLD
jgi:hypothetical protein